MSILGRVKAIGKTPRLEDIDILGKSAYEGGMKKLGKDDPIFPIGGICDVFVFIFSVWFAWTFIAKPVHDYVTELLLPDQASQTKDQQQLP